MLISKKVPFLNVVWISLLALCEGTTLLALRVSAQIEPSVQITPDNTLGEGSLSEIRFDDERGDFLIEGGSRPEGGSALFHSFTDFNMDIGQRVYFTDPGAIENIFSRVTGEALSSINGTLGVDGAANLYFLNPNGIVFGPNAQLNVNGSFTATTARDFSFGEEGSFGTSDTQAALPLVTIGIPIGIQFVDEAPVLTNQANLEVGEDLTLSGGSVSTAGLVSRAGGEISIEAETGLTEINGVINANGGQVNLSEQVNFNDGSDVVGIIDGGDGQLTIQGNTNFNNPVNIQGNDIIVSLLRTNGLPVSIRADGTVEVRDRIATTGSGSDDGGNITIVGDSVLFLALNEGGAIRLDAAAFDDGESGNISITANSGNVIFQGSSSETPDIIYADTFGTDPDPDNEGNIVILAEGGSISLDNFILDLSVGESVGEAFFTEDTSSANGGNISLKAGDIISLSNSVIKTAVEAGSTGNGGNISLQAGTISIENGSAISARTEGFGASGNISLMADTNLFLDIAQKRESALSLVLADNSSIITEATETGVTAGNIVIAGSDIGISDRSEVSASSLRGRAGTITINGTSLTLDESELSSENGQNAESEQSIGGVSDAIILTLTDTLRLQNESTVSSRGVNGANGGSISVLEVNQIVAGEPGSNGNDIIARGDVETGGQGGFVLFLANSVEGIATRPAVDGNGTNDIDSNGSVGLIETIVELDSLTVELPQNFAIAPEAVSDRCLSPSADDNPSQVSITGRGGVPTNPAAPLQPTDLETDWISLAAQLQTPAAREPSHPSETETSIHNTAAHSAANICYQGLSSATD